MVAFGFGEVIGGIVTGLLIDKIGPKKTCIYNVVVVILLISSTILNIS